MDFREHFILMSHDGPFHAAIAEGRPILRGPGLYHGKAGHGVSVEASVRKGPITIQAVTQTRNGRLKYVVAEGESMAGERLKIGNTNSRLRFAVDPASFLNAWCREGLTHHCALGIGQVRGKIEKVASLLGMEMSVIDRATQE